MTMLGNRYRLLDEIGSGAMGTVFRAHDRLTGQRVALKRVSVPSEFLAYATRMDADEDLDLLLAREFRILSSLRHPNIISVLDYGFADDAHQPYYTMELLDSAESFLEAAHGLDREGQIALLAQILQALAYLHRRGVLHRDLKPSNVLVQNGSVKLLDFGLSVMREQAPTGEVAGTPNYMAPEVWQGAAPTQATDLYAFGVMAYRVFTGELPFDAPTLTALYQQVMSEAPDLTVLANEPMLQFVVGRLLQKDPQERLSDSTRAITQFNMATNKQLMTETAATRESFLQAAAFVGRESELSTLSKALNGLLADKSAAYLLSGESGVGKSRLIDEVRTQALVAGITVLRGQAVDSVTTPYELWRDPLRWLALLTNPDDYNASVLKALIPDIEQLLERKVANPPEVTPAAAFVRLMNTVEGLFLRYGQPLVLMLEDLHWAEEESLALLHRIVTLSANLPLLIIASYRDDEQPALHESLADMTRLHLQRLNVQETAQLAEAMLGEAGRNPNLLALLQRETEGNAFFLVEVVRALAQESGQLEGVGQSPLPAHVLTGGVTGVIERRLGHVRARAQGLLKIAAVAGRSLDLAVLREVLGDQAAQLEKWLSDCADAAVLEVQDGRWRFAHNKLREGVLRDLPTDLLRETHRRVALANESVYQYGQPNAGLLAYHWRMAGDAEHEERFAALAGEQALKTGAYGLARAFFERALELQDRIETTTRRRAVLTQQVGEALMELRSYAAARAHFDASLALYREADYRWGIASSLTRLGEVSALLGELPQAAAHLLEALRVAMEARALAVAVSALASMAAVKIMQHEPMLALEYAELALNHPSIDGKTHFVAEQVIADVESDAHVYGIDATEIAAARARGRERDFRTTINALLEA